MAVNHQGEMEAVHELFLQSAVSLPKVHRCALTASSVRSSPILALPVTQKSTQLSQFYSGVTENRLGPKYPTGTWNIPVLSKLDTESLLGTYTIRIQQQLIKHNCLRLCSEISFNSQIKVHKSQPTYSINRSIFVIYVLEAKHRACPNWEEQKQRIEVQYKCHLTGLHFLWQ